MKSNKLIFFAFALLNLIFAASNNVSKFIF